MLAVDGSPHKNKTAWKQELKVKQNTFYVFSIHTANLSQTGLSAILRLNINGVSYPLTIPNKPYSWLRNSLKWQSGNATNAIIYIKDFLVSSNGNDFALDNIKLCECIPVETPPTSENKKHQSIPAKPKKEISMERPILEGKDGDSLEVVLNKTRVGGKIELNHIIFDQGKSFLKSTSFNTLNQLANYLIKNPRIEIEISGQTDNQGDASLNLDLSLDRVNAVKEYLVSKGISSNKITCKGYGGTMPIANNEAEETRKLNRRVEIKILKK